MAYTNMPKRYFEQVGSLEAKLLKTYILDCNEPTPVKVNK